MAEAEGEPYEGKVAIAAVIFNRAERPTWWGTTVKDVCLTAKQFSCWNDNNPRRNKIGEWDLDFDIYRECFRAALHGYDEDPTGGMDSYYAHSQVSPDWAKNLPKVVIGNHTFVRAKP